MNLKHKNNFDWEKCKSFEEKTFSEFYDPIKVYVGDFQANFELLGLKEQFEGKDVRVYSDDDMTGVFFECKMDTHVHSPNFFFEDISNTKTKSLGWTLKSKADILAYGFYDTNLKTLVKVYFIYMQDLISWFEKHYHEFEPKIIKNHGYNTIGRAVPIELMWDENLIDFIATKEFQIENNLFI